MFDDYQEASNASAFHAVIREALAEIPESVRVIVLSRTEPPPEIIRLSAAQRIQVVDFDKLRLTPEETRQIAAMKGVCDVDAVSFLHDKSAGWVAGLVLMLEQTGNTGATAEHLKTITLEAGISFFAGELFDSAAADSRDLVFVNK